MKKYNLSEIMHKAWKLYRKGVSSFAEALHRAWNSAKAAPVNAQRIEEAQQAAGITEPDNLSKPVIHRCGLGTAPAPPGIQHKALCKALRQGIF